MLFGATAPLDRRRLTVDDRDVLNQIEQLVDEERQLLDHQSRGALHTDGHVRPKSIEVSLNQCWDLLRQRRALRSAGADPDDAQVRDATTVEQYQQ
jgi:hypothetical protein